MTENDGADNTVRLLNTKDMPFPMKATKNEEIMMAKWTFYQKKIKYTMCFQKPKDHCQVIRMIFIIFIIFNLIMYFNK